MLMRKMVQHILTVAICGYGCTVATVEAAKSFPGKCLLEVQSKSYLNGKCEITMEEDGSFTITGLEKKKLTYFAMVSLTGKETGEGFWNEIKGANHAHTRLGDLVRQGACWQNQQAKVCAWK